MSRVTDDVTDDDVTDEVDAALLESLRSLNSCERRGCAADR